MNEEVLLSEKTFDRFRTLIYDQFGISLNDSKRALVQSRLRKWLIQFELDSYDDLYKRFTQAGNKEDLIILANAVTTNVTSFFREEGHWRYLREHIKTAFDYESRKIRIWSAGCSSGQEPYTIIIFLMEHLPNPTAWDIKILATDLSEEILKKAMTGIYTMKDLEGMPKYLLIKYFDKRSCNEQICYQIKEPLKHYVLFRSFNLVTGNFGIFSNRFDIVFCRNVMIYFDAPTRNQLIRNFTDVLHRGGHLLIGHSESIQEKQQQSFNIKMVVPSIYQVRE